ncbi:hypothetical protein Cagg_1644 [Chloroflexus aggregans DSM 9485]|uniref:Uncharacterized protein n=1 Tax=Chloroflexus aggregans (strain MD-66 / DSM 9485) TaxID=326427 RepID=B8GA30_CHLAD|nr:hypothetical protein Cagg_1644 [Chloroflexus aggregans DSM 9485]
MTGGTTLALTPPVISQAGQRHREVGSLLAALAMTGGCVRSSFVIARARQRPSNLDKIARCTRNDRW